MQTKTAPPEFNRIVPTYSLRILFFFAIMLNGCSTPKNIENKKRNTILSQIENGLIPRIQIEQAAKYFNLTARMKHYNVPGFAMATINDGKLERAKGYGYARKEASIKLDTNSIFQVGSISKSITALLVMKLHELGKLNIDEDISTYLKSWQLPESKFLEGHSVTLRNLLMHTSGLKQQQRMKLRAIGFSQGEEMASLNDILNGKTALQAVGFDRYPDTEHKYSNQGFNLIQKVLEDHMNEDFEDLAQRMILDPFEMKKSTFKTIIPTESNTAYCYTYKDGKANPGYWQNLRTKASGGLYSTPTDLAKCLIKISNIFNGKDAFISTAHAKELLAGEHYGLGFDLYRKDKMFLFSHSGRVPGFFAYMIMNPKTEDGFVMMTNSDDANHLFSEVLRGASKAFQWNFANPKSFKTIELDKTQYAKYLGNYLYKDEDGEYKLCVLEKKGKLIYIEYEENQEFEFPLGALSSNQFVDLEWGNKLDFVEENGKVSKLVYDKKYEYIKIE